MAKLPNDYVLSTYEALQIINRNSTIIRKIDAVYKLVYRKKGFGIKTIDGVRISVSALNEYIRKIKTY